jgi:hypothetical protein
MCIFMWMRVIKHSDQPFVTIVIFQIVLQGMMKLSTIFVGLNYRWNEVLYIYAVLSCEIFSSMIIDNYCQGYIIILNLRNWHSLLINQSWNQNWINTTRFKDFYFVLVLNWLLLREVVKVKARLITCIRNPFEYLLNWDDQNGIQCGKVFESSNGFKSVCNIIEYDAWI